MLDSCEWALKTIKFLLEYEVKPVHALISHNVSLYHRIDIGYLCEFS